AQGRCRQDDSRLAHHRSDRDAERQARAACALGAGDLEESLPAVQGEGREAGRQDRDHLGGQQGRQAHRRSDGELKDAFQALPDTTAARRGAGTSRTIHDTRRRSMRKASLCIAASALAVAAAAAYAQTDTQAEIERYRDMLQDGNPAELMVMRGEELWKMPRGPKNASLEKCDLGKGPGVLKGAYAELPRYFADTDQVMDAEARLVHCQVTLQGLDRAEVTKKPFSGRGQRATDNEVLVAYVVEQSRGMPVAIPQSHPKEI